MAGLDCTQCGEQGNTHIRANRFPLRVRASFCIKNNSIYTVDHPYAQYNAGNMVAENLIFLLIVAP